MNMVCGVSRTSIPDVIEMQFASECSVCVANNVGRFDDNDDAIADIKVDFPTDSAPTTPKHLLHV